MAGEITSNKGTRSSVRLTECLNSIHLKLDFFGGNLFDLLSCCVTNYLTIFHFGFQSFSYFQLSSYILKPLQNKKDQKNLGYPRKKQSFSL